jgi:hypothetical protein
MFPLAPNWAKLGALYLSAAMLIAVGGGGGRRGCVRVCGCGCAWVDVGVWVFGRVGITSEVGCKSDASAFQRQEKQLHATPDAQLHGQA